MEDSPPSSTFNAVIASADALADAPPGMTITILSLDIGSVSAATAAPLDVKNWEAFDGALLAVCFKYGDTCVIEGTALMIRLGLALSAKHVFDDHRDALASGEAVLTCFGMRPNGGLDIWQCYAMSTHDAGRCDLELLSLKLLSDLPPTAASWWPYSLLGFRPLVKRSQWWAFGSRIPSRRSR